MSEFDEYIVHGEPGQREKADAWQTAIGLQDVDGLKVSSYLLDTARLHIEGDISIDEARERIKMYYETKSGHDAIDEECGKIDAIIEKIGTQVERLKELKRSLINEVVTGKRAINII